MSLSIPGTIHGDVIKLDKPIGMAEGQKVEVTVRPAKESSHWGEGLNRCAGMLADEPQLDEALEEIYRDRKRASFRHIEE
jgi:hypothetical protein